MWKNRCAVSAPGLPRLYLSGAALAFSIRSASEVMPDAGSTPQPMVNSEICAMGVKLSQVKPHGLTCGTTVSTLAEVRLMV